MMKLEKMKANKHWLLVLCLLLLAVGLLVSGCSNTQAAEDGTTATATETEAGGDDGYMDTDNVEDSATADYGKYDAAESKVDYDSSSNSDSKSKKDKYETDPIPAGKPKPVEWQDAKVDKSKSLTATLSIDCKTILDDMEDFNKDKLSVLPSDGIILKPTKVTFYEGETVFDVLLRECKARGIHMEYVMTPKYNSNYIEGIHNLYEFDCGRWSGWMYNVNGWYPNYGCSRYPVKDGDVIEWKFTTDLGRDLGQEWLGEDWAAENE